MQRQCSMCLDFGTRDPRRYCPFAVLLLLTMAPHLSPKELDTVMQMHHQGKRIKENAPTQGLARLGRLTLCSIWRPGCQHFAQGVLAGRACSFVHMRGPLNMEGDIQAMVPCLVLTLVIRMCVTTHFTTSCPGIVVPACLPQAHLFHVRQLCLISQTH